MPLVQSIPLALLILLVDVVLLVCVVQLLDGFLLRLHFLYLLLAVFLLLLLLILIVLQLVNHIGRLLFEGVLHICVLGVLLRQQVLELRLRGCLCIFLEARINLARELIRLTFVIHMLFVLI